MKIQAAEFISIESFANLFASVQCLEVNCKWAVAE